MEEKIKDLIDEYKKGSLELKEEYDFHEIHYTDATKDVFVMHHVNDDIQFLFPEHKEIWELRDKIKNAKSNEEKLKLEDKFIHMTSNDMSDRFDYDDVVGYNSGYGIKFIELKEESK